MISVARSHLLCARSAYGYGYPGTSAYGGYGSLYGGAYGAYGGAYGGYGGYGRGYGAAQSS